MPEYNANFRAVTRVRIADRATLEDFIAIWKYHHPLTPDKLQYADRVTTAKKRWATTTAVTFSTSSKMCRALGTNNACAAKSSNQTGTRHHKHSVSHKR